MLIDIDNIRQKLIDLDLCVENKYLDKYIQLLAMNVSRIREIYVTEKHHIIPRCYYRYHNMVIDNSKNNLINLSHSDHLLAHYYLIKCAKYRWFREANLYCLNIFTSKNRNITEDELFDLLPDYQRLREEKQK